MRYGRQHSLGTVEIMKRIDRAHKAGAPLSLIRIGHAEMFVVRYHTWQHDMVDFDSWMKYCGITNLETDATGGIISAIRKATVVGIHHHTDVWQERMREIFDHYDLAPPLTCSAWVTHYMVCRPDFRDLVRRRRIAVVGRRAGEVVDRLEAAGARSVHPLTLDGFEDMTPVLNSLNSLTFDIALVAGGLPATILCPQIAETTGEVAIDFGHALDLLIDGVENLDCQEYYEELVRRYNREVT